MKDLGCTVHLFMEDINMGQCCGCERHDIEGLARQFSNIQTNLDKLKVILQRNAAFPENAMIGQHAITVQPGRNVRVNDDTGPIQSQENGISLIEQIQSSLSDIIERLPKKVRKKIENIHQKKENQPETDYSSHEKRSQNQDMRSEQYKRRNSNEEEKQPKSQKKGPSDGQIKSSSKKPDKKKCTVQLYYTRGSDILDGVAHELKEKLDSCPNIKVIDCKSIEDIQKSIPTICLCFNASRLGTDVSGAMKELHYPENTVMLVLHHKLEHALPSNCSEQLLTDPEYQSLGRITDMAFFTDKGFYPCGMNNEGFRQLIAFIESKST